MVLARKPWDATSGESWAEVLGLVPVPLFGAGDPKVKGKHAILLDGQHGSFAFSAVNDMNLIQSDDLLSWAWSANVRHSLVVSDQQSMMFLRRWDVPGVIRRFRLPERGQTAIEVFEEIEKAPPPRAPDVVRHVLSAFRLVRQALCDQDALYSVRLLNGLLLLGRRVQQSLLTRSKLLAARTVGELVSLLPARQRHRVELEHLPREVSRQSLGVLVHAVLDPDPRTGCIIQPSLLLRHAASRLYQEAHLLLEREPQPVFPGFGETGEPAGELPRDARFTPANMARAFAQKALDACGLAVDGAIRKGLVVLDPACGSGIFLLECLREMIRRGIRGKVSLAGYDKSPIAASISRFCLEMAADDAKDTDLDVEIDIQCKDALLEPWTKANLILMNPPFVPFENLGSSRQAVSQILGAKGIATGRFDMAMAFVTKAVDSLLDYGALATVLPAPLLANESGVDWRRDIGRSTDLLLLGRFEGYGYFDASTVETGFALLRKSQPGRTLGVQVVIAKPGSEDAALRLLRSSARGPTMESPAVELFSVTSGVFTPASWLPLRKSTYQFREILRASGLPCVNDLFAVHQGVRTGDNRSFLLSVLDWNSLPEAEKCFFRPAAGQGTIRDGRLIRSEYVFYPYDLDGPTIRDEDELRRKVPNFYENRLLPRKSALERRARVTRWWLLTLERSWQRGHQPKLVTTYFGVPGSFSYDGVGDSAVVQGHGWLWKSRLAPHAGDDLQASLHETPLPWAYVALFNSGVFGRVLACYCPRVQGGQFNLSPRFVKKVPVPNLGSPDAFAAGIVQELAEMGRAISANGGAVELRDSLDRAASRAYGLPLAVSGA